jgi:hypothetical protein
VPHNFTAIILPGADNTLGYVAVAFDALVVTGLPQLGWKDSSAVVAGTRAAPRLTVAGAVCLPAFLEVLGAAATAAMEELLEITMWPSLAFLNRCADCCASLSLFDVALLNAREWRAKLSPALARLPSPSPFMLRGGDLVEANAFVTAAVAAVAGRAAVPAVAGARATRAAPARPRVPAVPAILAVAAIPARSPAALEWWGLVKVKHSYDANAEFPLEAAWYRGQACPDRISATARDDPSSRTQAVAAILYRHLGFALNDESASHAERARALRRVGDRLFTLPAPLLSHSFDADALETEIADAFTFAKSAEGRDSVTAGRLAHGARTYSDAWNLLERLPNVAARRDAIEALTVVLSANETKLSLFARLGPVDEFLKSNSALIIQSHNRRIPVTGPEGIISLLLKEHNEWNNLERAGGSVDQPESDDQIREP